MQEGQTMGTLSSQKQINIGDLFVNKKYTVINTLHEGPHSKIHVVAFLKNNNQITRSLKLIPKYIIQQHPSSMIGELGKKSSTGTLKNQILTLKAILNSEHSKIGFPNIFQFGTQQQYQYMIMDLFGPNLLQLMKLCGGRFSKKTGLMVGLQILDRIETIHSCGYLHRNVRPQNFVVGLGKDSFLIFMIDFSKALKYKSQNKGVHIPYQQVNRNESQNSTRMDGDHGFSLNVGKEQNLFTSVNHHLGAQSARRDDIQSLMFLILFMIKGRLPWYGPESGGPGTTAGIETKQDLKQLVPSEQNINCKSTSNIYNTQYYIYFESNSQLLQIKRKVSFESLFKGISFELIDIMYYIRTLSFYEKPDYSFLKKKLWNALQETDCQQLLNNVILYDWSQREALDYDIYRQLPRLRLQQFDEQKEKDKIKNKDRDRATTKIHFEVDQNSDDKRPQKISMLNKFKKQQKANDEFDIDDEANLKDEDEQSEEYRQGSFKNNNIHSNKTTRLNFN